MWTYRDAGWEVASPVLGLVPLTGKVSWAGFRRCV